MNDEPIDYIIVISLLLILLCLVLGPIIGVILNYA